jgi:ferredoxin--NADP+ reductase
MAMAAVACKPTKRHATAAKKKGVKMAEGKEIPWNLFGPKSPYAAKCISNETISEKTMLVNWETCHIVIDHDGKYPYIEGQSLGVISPGPDKGGKTPAKMRLYSIASSSCGDDEQNKTVSLCIKRVLEVSGRGWCEHSNVEPGTDREFPDAEKVYRGVCSTFLCDLKAGEEVLITGPTGAEMLLPTDPEANVIMLATGTGIAPFRSFLRCLFHDKATKGKFKGVAWLFLGVPFTKSVLYDEENKAMQAEFPTQFRYDYAISDETKRADGTSMYVQHRVQECISDIWPMVKDPRTHVYMCGLKGMATGMIEAIEPSCNNEGLDAKEFLKAMKKEGRYHVEVY